MIIKKQIQDLMDGSYNDLLLYIERDNNGYSDYFMCSSINFIEF